MIRDAVPGVVAMVWAGWHFAAESWAIDEHSSITVEGPPIYPFKTVIPIAGAFLLAQGLVEIVRTALLAVAAFAVCYLPFGTTVPEALGRRSSRRPTTASSSTSSTPSSWRPPAPTVTPRLAKNSRSCPTARQRS